jgi:E-phenylitaconyl-CoA hydratase
MKVGEGMSVIYEKKDNIAYLTLNRPEAMNSLDPETQKELEEIFNDFEQDDSLRVAILTGAGEKAFCTGSDLKKTMPPSTSVAETYFQPGTKSLTRDLKLSKPIICAINGYALAGGMELAMACDIRIASENASFGLTEAKIGSIPGAGGTQRLPRLIPLGYAMKLLLTGDRISAAEAHRLGIVTDIVPQNELMSTAEEIARKIANNAPLSVRMIKKAVLEGLERPLDEGLQLERFLFNMLRDTEDRIEGRKAFAEKRSPVFKGR